MKRHISILFSAICFGIAGCHSGSNESYSSNSSPNYSSPDQSGQSYNSPATQPGYASGTTEPSDANGPTTNPDNTAINARDINSGTVTPASQGESNSDIQVTADIRRQVIGQHLSIDAQNVKIITENGHVTLRGPVDTQAEKDEIGRIANERAGAGNVDNELEVLPNG